MAGGAGRLRGSLHSGDQVRLRGPRTVAGRRRQQRRGTRRGLARRGQKSWPIRLLGRTRWGLGPDRVATLADCAACRALQRAIGPDPRPVRRAAGRHRASRAAFLG